MTAEHAAWLVLRVVYAWMFLYPLIALFKDFNAAVGLVELIVPFQAKFFTMIMVIVMFFGAVMIFFGIYAQIAGFFLMFYCLIGARVHYKLMKKVSSYALSISASEVDKQLMSQATQLGAVGHLTSAEKNFVLAAVGFFFMILGSGPWSVTTNLF